MTTEVMINDWTKYRIVEKENWCEVTHYELMGGRWVALGPAENWSKELVKEELL